MYVVTKPVPRVLLSLPPTRLVNLTDHAGDLNVPALVSWQPFRLLSSFSLPPERKFYMKD